MKNSFVNYAFENCEANYRALILMAEVVASDRLFLQQTLTEEQRMAEWINDNLPMITRRYAELSAQKGQFASKV